MRSMFGLPGGGSRSRPCSDWKCADMGDDWPSMSSTVPGLCKTPSFSHNDIKVRRQQQDAQMACVPSRTRKWQSR